LTAFVLAYCALLAANSPLTGHLLDLKRSSASDLEVTGMIAGVPPVSTRYISYEKLLTLPTVTVPVTGDSNFTEIPQEKLVVTGIYLDVLAKSLGADPASDLIDALCADGYRANFSREYIQTHRPILVLKINGLPVKTWVAQTRNQTHNQDLGTYFITHAAFTPVFNVLSHKETPQVPTDITKLEFSSVQRVFGAIAPRGPTAVDRQVTEGYRIAQEHCYRCHNLGSFGGTKAKQTWRILGDYAALSPDSFEQYIRNPKSVDPKSPMPPNPEFDDATLKALQAYFKPFHPRGH
jgi:mono/diheme cytochrome c family protein